MRSVQTCPAEGENGCSLSELRRSVGMSQHAVADRMRVSQPHVARFEHQDDMHVNSLRRYVAALGGELTLVVRLGRKRQEIRLPVEAADG